MVMRSLYRASGGLVGPVGARPGERGHGAHHHRRRVAAAQEVIAQAHGSAFTSAPKNRGQTPAAGVEAALGLGRLGEGGGDGGGDEIARYPLLGQFLLEAPAADAAATG